MGLFKTNDDAKQPKNDKEEAIAKMIVSSAVTLDQPFETIGLVTAVVQISAIEFGKLIRELKEKAIEQGADAIIGFQAMQVQSPALKLLHLTGYGTAVRYKKEMQG